MLMALPEGILRADGISGLVIFAVLYMIISFIGKMKQAKQRQEMPPPVEPRPRPERTVRAERRPTQVFPPKNRQPGDTQREALKLEELLKVLGEAAGLPVPDEDRRIGRPARTPLPGAEEVEERESLEEPERILNLEESVPARAARRDVDHDDEAEAIVQRRIRAAELRDRALTRADHAAFDARIRKEPPDQTRVVVRRPASLRDALVWREILGPPLGLRDREPGH